MPDLDACKLIAVAGSATAGEVETYRQQGFAATLSRPFEVGDVVRIIESVLGPPA